MAKITFSLTRRGKVEFLSDLNKSRNRWRVLAVIGWAIVVLTLRYNI